MSLSTKILSTISNYPVRSLLYRTGQEPVPFSHERWSRTPDHSKNSIPVRSGIFCSVRTLFDQVWVWFGSDSKSNNQRILFFFNFMDPIQGLVRYRTVLVGDRYGAWYQFSILCSPPFPFRTGQGLKYCICQSRYLMLTVWTGTVMYSQIHCMPLGACMAQKVMCRASMDWNQGAYRYQYLISAIQSLQTNMH